jgi:protein TonB
LFAAVLQLYPAAQTQVTTPVFDIDIVGPVEEETSLSKDSKQVDKEKVPQRKKTIPPRVLEENPPETLLGEGTSAGPQEEQSGKTTENQKREAESPGKSSPHLKSDRENMVPEGDKNLSIEPKTFLFDKETIEKYARKKPAENQGKGKGLTFQAPELKHRGYMRMLKDKIERVWRYPEQAARRGNTGDLYIAFTIQRDGKLGEKKLIRTSGHRDLDEAALEAIENAAPFWPLPDDWEGEALTINGHFIYFIGGAYVL